VGGDLVETEPFVIIGADPFRRIDRALLQRGIDVASGQLLRHAAELLHDTPSEAADAKLQSLQVVDARDLLAEPAAHLTPGVAREQGCDVVAFVKFVEDFLAATEHVPGLVDARVGTEWNRRTEGECRVLAEIIIRRRVSHLDSAVLHGVKNLQARNDFAGGECLNLEFVVGCLANNLGHHFGSAVKSIERFRPTGRQTPFDLRHRLRDRRRGNGRSPRNAYSRDFDKVSTLH
jgi:hypothetical protein